MNVLRYSPADPASVASVDRFRLFTDEARTDPPAVDVTDPMLQTDGSWLVDVGDSVPDGTYYASVTVTYTDASTSEDRNDVVTFPLETVAQLGEPIALWADPAAIAAKVTTGNAEQAETAARIATDVLYVLSGRQFPGLRVTTLRVPPSMTGPRELLPSAAPWDTVGSRLGRGCSRCVSGYDPLLYPIRSVVRLTLGGVEIPPEQIDASNGRTVRITRGTTSDPLAVNRWCADDGYYSLFPGGCGCAGPGAELTILWGRDVPAGGKAAALAFGVELAKGLAGDTACRLPGNVINVARQGVTVVLDPTVLFDKGRTGIAIADIWLMSVNPKRRVASPLVFWPGSPLPDVVG